MQLQFPSTKIWHMAIVATLALACDQGKGVARCGPNNRPESAIVWEENSKCQW
jgi:hypothetical protein